jgi:hypothetical protein
MASPKVCSIPTTSCSSSASQHSTPESLTCYPLLQLSDPSLIKNACYVNGQWVAAKSGKDFSVESKHPNQYSPGQVLGMIDMLVDILTLISLQTLQALKSLEAVPSSTQMIPKPLSLPLTPHTKHTARHQHDSEPGTSAAGMTS